MCVVSYVFSGLVVDFLLFIPQVFLFRMILCFCLFLLVYLVACVSSVFLFMYFLLAFSAFLEGEGRLVGKK